MDTGITLLLAILFAAAIISWYLANRLGERGAGWLALIPEESEGAEKSDSEIPHSAPAIGKRVVTASARLCPVLRRPLAPIRTVTKGSTRATLNVGPRFKSREGGTHALRRGELDQPLARPSAAQIRDRTSESHKAIADVPAHKSRQRQVRGGSDLAGNPDGPRYKPRRQSD